MRLDAREAQQPPPGQQRPARVLLGHPVEVPVAVLEPELCYRVSAAPAFGEPGGELRGPVGERMQLRSRDDEQRDAVDAVIVQPVADQRAALERGRLDVVQRDRDAFHAGARIRA